ncbi:MAG: TRL-like protein family [Chlorobi bacterium]|nr:TRL-like protein family [Chlorobiota bacterium]
MRRKTQLLGALVLAGTFFLSGCIAMYPSVVGPAAFGMTTEPVAVGTGKAGSNMKVGTAECTNILGLISSGDCSIHEAARDAGIKTISYVDKEVSSVLGIFTKVTIKVYGY